MNHLKRLSLLCLALLAGVGQSACGQSAPSNASNQSTARMNNDANASDELKEKLSPEAYQVTQMCGTEPPFSGKYWDEHRAGTYHCVVCDLALFSSEAKFESGSGWPSYFQPISGEHVAQKTDRSHGMVRTEVTCARCGAHLGHVFRDGPKPTGLRYCINSAAMTLAPADSTGSAAGKTSGE